MPALSRCFSPLHASRTVRMSFTLPLLLLLALVMPVRTEAYAVMTHRHLVDLLWASEITPLLRARFPDTSPDELRNARSFAYGGALIADAGYYPKGEAFTSDITHYIRSGDFVTNLFRTATDVYELAFAVGALTHYVGDALGHSCATNPSVADAFAGVKRTPGSCAYTHLERNNSARYEDGPAEHRQVEFGFDVNMLNRGRFMPKKVSDRIGFDVTLQQLTYAFYLTYGLKDDFTEKGFSLNASAYNRASDILPAGTDAVAHRNRKLTVQEAPTAELDEYNQLLDSAKANGHWREYKQTHGKMSQTMQILIALHPTFDIATIKGPTTITQQRYLASIVSSVHVLRQILQRMKEETQLHPAAEPADFLPQWPAGDPLHAVGPLPNFNLDTGELAGSQPYRLANKAYSDLLHKLVENESSDPNWKIPASVSDALGAHLSTLAQSATSDNDLASLRALHVRQTDGCPRGTFGMRDTGWRDPNPEHRAKTYKPFASLCDK